MRQLFDCDVVTLIDEEKDYWHKISQPSNFTFFFIVFGQLIYFKDLTLDVWLIYEYATAGQWTISVETAVILVGTAIFQSYHYYHDQRWIDANHKFLPKGSENSLQSSKHNTETEMININNDNNFAQISGSQDLSLSSVTNRFFCWDVNSSMWIKIRCFFQLFLLTSPFRAIFCWKDRKQKQKLLQSRRARRLPIDRQEIVAAVATSERDITDQTLQMFEQCFESLPQTILQIYFVSTVGLKFEFSCSWRSYLRIGSIIFSIFFAAVASTKYSRDYFKHLKTLHFQDYFFFGQKTEFLELDWISIISLFISNLSVIVCRIYGIGLVLVLYGQGSTLMFLTLLYTAQFAWLQIHSSCRLVYENPPRGISTMYSNLIDRGMNIFTFHMLKPTLCIIFMYNLIFLCCMTTIFDSIRLSSIVIQNSSGNETLVDLSNEQTYQTVLWSYPLLLYVWSVSTVVCLLTGDILEKRLCKQQFPLMKGFPFWKNVMRGKKWDYEDLSVRRYVCLCVLATDDEFYRVFNPMCCKIGFGYLNRTKLDELWQFKVERLNPAVPADFHSLQQKWSEIRNRKLKFKYLSELLSLVDSAFMDGPDCVPISDFQMFLNLVKHFEIRLTERSSFRLMNTQNFVKQIHETRFADISDVSVLPF